MLSAEVIATALEMSIATLMLLFAGFIGFGSGVRTIAARALAVLTAIVGVSMVLSLLGSNESLAGLRRLKPAVALLFGPALFVYLSQVRLDSRQLGHWSWLHLLPTIGVLLLMLADANRFTDAYLNVFIGGYWIAIVAYVANQISNFRPDALRRFVIGLIAVFGIVFIADAILSIQAREIGRYRDLPVYLFGLLALLLAAARMMWTALTNPLLLASPESAIKYARSGLADSEIDAIGARLESLMHTDKVFLTDDIDLASVAGQLGVTPRNLSQVVNSRFGRNFSAYVNELRVREAGDRLKRSEASVTDIMYDVGFSSKSTFNREFKRHFGMSPKAWRTSELG